MIRNLLLAIAVLGVVVGVTFFVNDNNVVYENVTPKKEVHRVSELEEKIKDAQEAEMERIKQRAQEAYDDVLEEELQRIADQVKIEYIAELEKTIESESY